MNEHRSTDPGNVEPGSPGPFVRWFVGLPICLALAAALVLLV
ncbi:MAG: hypothetical protein QOD94_2714 [Alphaproteobacteria bacterium]|jgi:hypothetical protein|nr:hypothetical protein [Alphaproteobacteria bacterium]